ncbi:hypothetical protein BS47DRAFT_1094080 [Hydnum rufescens UP504]|uniref:Uncharacterized protein n=1 Tax=Hydnum rufescens UP504 TaxID=1448309 RepID=A0A9P6AUG5_9AGAM|nr:hypothetical protein BS47DRAFT_1094080 [Hydnum rufescens UP504]
MQPKFRMSWGTQSFGIEVAMQNLAPGCFYVHFGRSTPPGYHPMLSNHSYRHHKLKVSRSQRPVRLQLSRLRFLVQYLHLLLMVSWDPHPGPRQSDKTIQVPAPNVPPSRAQTVTPSLPTNTNLSGAASLSPSAVRTRPALLVLDTVSSRAEARSLVQKAQEGIIALANYSPDSPIPPPSLAEQLEAYGQTLQLERRFARGEAQKDIKINTSTDEAESEDDQENDFIGSPPVPGQRSPPLMPQGVSAFAPDINRLYTTTSLDNAKPHYTHLSYHRTPPEAPRVGHSVIGSLNGPHFLTGSARRRPRPIPKISSLQHKRSLDAWVPGLHGLNDDEDDGGSDASDPGDVRARLAKSRLGSNIEIIKTLPTPTESPVGAASAFHQIGDSPPPIFVDDPSTPPPGSPSFDAGGTSDVHAGSDSETYVPLSRVFTAPSRVTLGQVQYSASAPPLSVVRAPLSPSRSVTGFAPSPPRLGRRFGLRNLVQTLKGK